MDSGGEAGLDSGRQRRNEAETQPENPIREAQFKTLRVVHFDSTAASITRRTIKINHLRETWIISKEKNQKNNRGRCPDWSP